MSRETMTWLNQNTLIGHTDKRGHAWHYRADAQGDEPNHYTGAVPIEDVRRRLFHWQAVAGPLTTTILTEDGVLTCEDPDKQVIVRPDTGTIFGVFSKGYKIHQYDEWLLNNVSTILDDDLTIGSAGLLKGGAVAWVSVEVPDTLTTPEGVDFRPNLLACTSCDGSLATTYQRIVTAVVCDNTLSVGLSEKGQRVKVKHSSKSLTRIGEARDALAIVHSIADDFQAQVKELCETTVTDKQWAAFLDAHAPMPEEKGRGMTMMEAKRAELSRLWNHDERAATWKGTAFGVLQAVNTYTHHLAQVKGTSRVERNQLRAVKGEVDALDRGTIETLTKVLATV